MAAQEMILKLMFNDDGTFAGLEEINKELKKVDESTAQTSKGFTSAKAELRALQNQMLEMDQSSEEFKIASRRAAELKDNISDLSAEINANAGNAFEGLSNNVGLFGSRLMDLDLKGAGQALSGMGAAVRKIDFKTVKEEIGGLIKGLANLGASVISNPFFLIVGVLAAIAYNYKDIAKWASQTSLEQQNLAKVTDDLNKATEQELAKGAEKIAQVEILTARVKDNNLTEKERQQALRDLETMYPAYFSNLNGDINDTEALNAAKEKLITNIKAEAKANAAKSLLEAEYAKKIALEQELNAKKGKLSQAEFDKAVADARFNQQTLFKETNQNITEWWNGTEGVGQAAVNLEESIQRIAYLEQEATSAVLANVNTEVKAIREKTKAAATAAQTKREKEEAERQKEIDDYNKSQEEITAILAKWEEERLAIEAQLAAYQKAAREDRLTDEERIAEEIYQSSLSAQQKEIDAVRTKYFELITLAEFYGQDTTALKEAQAKAELEITKKYAEEEQKIEDEKRAKKLANIQSNFEMAELAVGALIDLNQSAAKGDEASQRKTFERNKMLQKAQATIAMASGIVQQLAVPQDQLTGMNFAKAAAVAAAGIANIVKINQTQYGGSTPSASGGNLTAPSASNAPAIDFSAANLQTNAPGGLETYVLAGNVANALEARQKIIDQSYL